MTISTFTPHLTSFTCFDTEITFSSLIRHLLVTQTAFIPHWFDTELLFNSHLLLTGSTVNPHLLLAVSTFIPHWFDTISRRLTVE